jgi:LmbE family N-acetylglucosaminyl deacetylase
MYVLWLQYNTQYMKKIADLHPEIVLAIGAHPDDIDFGFSGSIAAWAAAGANVYYLIITDGSKGTPDRAVATKDLVKAREAEQRAAAKLLGAQDVFFMGYADGELEVTLGLKKQVVRFIRQLKPDTVLTMDPTMVYSSARGFINHPDHRAAGQTVLDAVFPLARDHLAFPDLITEGLEPHKVRTVLMTNFDNHNFAIDITDSLDKKLAALAAHASQMPDLEITKERITEWASTAGKLYGYTYAEVFVRLDLAL